jgi:hypothetical protein
MTPTQLNDHPRSALHQLLRILPQCRHSSDLFQRLTNVPCDHSGPRPQVDHLSGTGCAPAKAWPWPAPKAGYADASPNSHPSSRPSYGGCTPPATTRSPTSLTCCPCPGRPCTGPSRPSRPRRRRGRPSADRHSLQTLPSFVAGDTTLTGTLTGPGRVDQQRREPLHPALDGDVVDRDAAFGQQLFDVSVRQAIPHVPPAATTSPPAETGTWQNLDLAVAPEPDDSASAHPARARYRSMQQTPTGG